MMKNILIAGLLIVLIGVGAYYLQTTNTASVTHTNTASSSQAGSPTASSTVPGVPFLRETVIGTSSGSHNITAYHIGTGTKEVLFVGGVHGGYEWNTVLLAYDIIDYLKAHPEIVPSGLTVTVIPTLNPDGLQTVVGTTSRFAAKDVNPAQATQIAGRFNSNKVDLNRNFDCDWQASGTWQNTKVSGGTAAFSEPESMAMQTYVERVKPAAVVVWFSSAGGVYSSRCGEAILGETSALTNLYARASGYPAKADFDSYAVTGDMTNWLAKNNIPAISVLLTNHTDTESIKNQAAVRAVLERYAR